MDIGAWLRNVGLGQYEATFRENEVDGEILPKLTVDDLRDIGIIAVGHRRKIMSAIEALNAPSANPAAAQTATPAAAMPSAFPDAAERRQLTVMFSDLVGSTALSARLDPEDMRRVIRAYQDAVSGVVARYDGFVAKFMGDGVLAYFGFPRAHEDDAARSVHAGLEIAHVVAGLETPAREKLAARIGMATGLVVVGDIVGEGAAQEQAVVGDTPNLAARLQGLADAGGVVISAATRRLVVDTFRLKDLGRHDVKGLTEPVEAFAALGVAATESRFEAAHASRLTGFVGREAEAADLVARQRRAWQGRGQIVLISGEAGIGKSRLAAWVAEQAADAPHTRLRYQCSPYHRDSALYPFAQQIERAADFGAQDSAEAKLDKLEQVLALATDRLDEVAPLIAAMLSIPTGNRYPTQNLSPAQQRRQTLFALLDQMEGLAKKQPILMLFEDAHWADATSLEVIDLAIERMRRLPVLLLITFRREFEAPWRGLPNVAEIALGRLERAEAEALVERVTDGRKLPAEVLAQIIAKTDGVPLFIEELTKNIIQSGLLIEKADHYRLDGPLPPLAIPSTLQDSLMARLDRLAAVKEIAQIGAAIGREFSYPLLAAVVGRDEATLKISLAQLEESELVFRSGQPPAARYAFKHALVQDTAYETLLKSRRQILHLRIAEALRDKFPDTAETEPELLAHHFTQAALTEPAISYWLQAGTRAANRFANREAIMHFRRGLDGIAALPDNLDRDRVELNLQFSLGPCLIANEGPRSARAVANFTRARELCERLGSPPEHQHVLHWLNIMHGARGELPQAVAVAKSGIKLAEIRDDRPALMNSLRGQALAELLMGRLQDAREGIERAVAIFEAADEAQQLAARAAGQDAGVAGLAVLSWSIWALGYPDSAGARIAAALERANSIESPHTQAYAQFYASILAALRGQTAIALAHAESCLSLAETHGFVHWRGPSRVVKYVAQNLLHPTSEGADAVLAELDDYRSRGYHMGATAVIVVALRWLLTRRKFDAAHKFMAMGYEALARNDERLFEAEFHRMKARLLLAEQGALAFVEAQSMLLEAIATAQRQAARSLELCAACDLGRLWRSEGRDDEARNLLSQITGWFTEGADGPDLTEARAVLSGL